MYKNKILISLHTILVVFFIFCLALPMLDQLIGQSELVTKLTAAALVLCELISIFYIWRTPAEQTAELKKVIKLSTLVLLFMGSFNFLLIPAERTFSGPMVALSAVLFMTSLAQLNKQI
ncbi:hypothetical protein ACL9RI_24560 [Janthinobacterium sp. Mn2066]|uniref:hypothetical protein n=1 Tax=Janthinobacterium sp. Mn2066 TaxID=3395264 RepID=UPI003BC3B9E8